jgi:hypothetical protein
MAKNSAQPKVPPPPTSLEFFDRLNWIDGRPLLNTIDQYRRDIFSKALDSFDVSGAPAYNMVLAGRGKKNWKTADLILAALYSLLIRESPQGNAGLILANDEGQAADDLQLAKRLVDVNPDLGAELEPLAKEIRRRDGKGSLRILPARDVAGAHGKTAIFLGYDEIHGYRNYDLLEALAPDPTRSNCLTWITSYATIYNTPGIPLYDFIEIGKAGTDQRMLFSWLRANPSIASWAEGRKYLDQQRRRLPTHKFRRLHLNLPGAPNGAFYDQGAVMRAIVRGRRFLRWDQAHKYFAFVDMSGGSSDDAVLAIGHVKDGKVIIDVLIRQAGNAPFNPMQAVERFAVKLREYQITRVMGDNYAGLTFKEAFKAQGIDYLPCPRDKTDLYEALEPVINAGEVELLEIPVLQEQLLCLVVKGAKVDHEPGGHDDYANAVAGVVFHARRRFGHSGLKFAPVPFCDGNGVWTESTVQAADPSGTAQANAAGWTTTPAGQMRGNGTLRQKQREPWQDYFEWPGSRHRYWGPV